MFEILPQSADNLIGFKVSGKLAKEDYEQLMPKLDEAIEAHGKINLLVYFESFEGWSDLGAAKADFEFGIHEYRQVEKAAFVGDTKLIERMVKIMDPFTRRTEERYFPVDQMNDAWDWIKAED